MKTIGLDYGDIAVRDGRFVMASGKECQGVMIQTAIKTLLGELVLDLGEGIDYFGTVFSNTSAPYAARMWEELVRERVMEFPFVVSIIEFEYEIDKATTTLNYKMIVETQEDGVSNRIVISSEEQGSQFKPLDGIVVDTKTDDDMRSAAKTIIEALGGTVK